MRKLLAIAVLVILIPGPVIATAQQLPGPLAEALEAARTNQATPGQKALLFQNNDVINRAALNGWIPDRTYQAAQREYAQLNSRLAEKAAKMEGAKFTTQVSKNDTYSPGTDSDYIVTTTSDNPVGQIEKIQQNYNKLVNEHLSQALSAEGMHHVPKDDWLNRLDVDFMADPTDITDEQFRKIAKLNNDAYKRRGAAEYERRLRGKNQPPITSQQFSDYAAEMQDFVDKKERLLSEFRENPGLMADPDAMADMHILMAQESKYVSRIEEAAATLRGQEWLPGSEIDKGPPVYELTTQPDGQVKVRARHTQSIAARGARRSRVNRGAAIVSSAVVGNSVERALGDLADAMTEAAQKNPEKWKDAPTRIAEVTERMSAEAKGRLLERIRDQWSGVDQGDADAFARRVATEMRKRPGKSPTSAVGSGPAGIRPGSSMTQSLDDAIRSGLGISDDLADMTRARRGLNQMASQALGQLDRLETLGNVADAAEVALHATTYVSNLQSAMDPNLSDQEADEHFRRAQQAALSLAKTGAMGAATQAVPALGAVVGGWTIGYDGTRYVLENTETGRRIDRKTEEYFQRHGQAVDRARSTLTEYFGGESEQMAEQRRQQDLESSYWRALREGRIQLKPGVRTVDVAAALRDGDLISVHGLIEPGENGSEELLERLTALKPDSTNPAAATQSRRSGPQPIDSIEFENQTFDLAGDAAAKNEYDDLLLRGKSPIGPAEHDGRDGLPMTDRISSSSTTDSPKPKSPGAVAKSDDPEPGSVEDLLNLTLADDPDPKEDSPAANTAQVAGNTGHRNVRSTDDQMDALLNTRSKDGAAGKRDGFDIDDLLTFDKDDVLTFDKDDVLTTGRSNGSSSKTDPALLDDLLTFDKDDLAANSSTQTSNTRPATGNSGVDAYRQRAREINNQLVAVERAREDQRRAAQAEYARQQEVNRQRALALQRERQRQQQIAAQQQLARQQQIWRQQQYARNVAAMQQQQLWLRQQAQQQQMRSPRVPMGPPSDGTILGPNYDPRPRGDNPFLRPVRSYFPDYP